MLAASKRDELVFWTPLFLFLDFTVHTFPFWLHILVGVHA